MRKTIAIGMAAVMVLMAFMAIPSTVAANGSTTIKNYGDVTLSGGFQAGHFDDIWDLTCCDMTISFTYDATDLVDDAGAHAWAQLGIREVGYGDFNPTWQVEGAGVWLATDYDWNVNTFDPDPDPPGPILDMDDKLILQKAGGHGEGDYNLPSAPPNPGANHAVWFDRDGVDPWQALMWGAIDSVTYNTGGTYNVVITLHADDAMSGTAYMAVNGEDQGFYVPGWHSGPADLMPAGMTFTGDMEHMQVFYGLYGYGTTHTVSFKDITVEGCLYWTDVEIDIKPGSYPNSINLKSKGKVPVAVLTTDDFDASTVDPETVLFASAMPVRWTMEDINGDGDNDMLFHFNIQDLNLDQDSTEATLTGDTTDGKHIKGTDTVNIVPNGRGR